MAEPLTVEKVVLEISRSDSTCGACRRPVLPDAKSHDQTVGYQPGPGCGATFTHVIGTYTGAAFQARVKAMRPDLIFIDLGIPLEPTDD
jgi:hypothetical protein